ncbi:MAG: DUF433 domain-containing protein [Boseongicola sp.]|nr:DUF433 domain-containing protein [Boseongicola sp.]
MTNRLAVERNPRKISGDWAFAGTRVPAYALFGNQERGATVKEVLQWHPEIKERQEAAILKRVAELLRITVWA